MTFQRVGTNLNLICDEGRFETAPFTWNASGSPSSTFTLSRQSSKYVQAGSFGGIVQVTDDLIDLDQIGIIKFNAVSGTKYVVNCYVKTSPTVPVSATSNYIDFKLFKPIEPIARITEGDFPEVNTLISGITSGAVQLQSVYEATSTGVAEIAIAVTNGGILSETGIIGGELYFDSAEVFEIQDLVDPCIISIDSLTITDDSGASDGVINVNASGATNIEYKVTGTGYDSGWVSGDVFSGLVHGTYTVEVRDGDAISCFTSSTAIIALSNPGSTEITTINEDGIQLTSKFTIDTTKNVLINQVGVKLIAYNTVSGNSFELDTFDLDLSSGSVISGIPTFNINTTRNYELRTGDKFNTVSFVNGALVGTDQEYILMIGQKIKWQDWLENPDVDDVFENTAEPNDNFNFKASNYSGLLNYVIKLETIVNVTGLDDTGRLVTGDSINLGGTITVQDYTEVGIGAGDIFTADLETNTSLGGAVLYNGKDTLFRAIFNDKIDLTYAILRIEPVNNTGDGIFELSTINLPPANNLIKPLEGETLAKVTQVGESIYVEGLIDGDLIEDGVNYKLSARLEEAAASEPFILRVKSDNTGTSASNQFTIPTNGAGYNYTAIADGVTYENNTGDLTLTFPSGVGTYDVEISGDFPAIYFNNVGDKSKLIEVVQFGEVVFSTFNFAFYGCNNLTAVSGDILQAVSLSNAFLSCTSLVSVDSTNWVIGGTLTQTFRGCSSLTTIDVSLWDVSAVGSFQGLFNGCTSLVSLDTSNWVTANASNMVAMFFNCISLTTLDVSGWDVTGLSSLQQLFTGCSSLVSMGVSSWDVSNASNMTQIFSGCSVFDEDISGWVTSSATDFEDLFFNAAAFDYDLSGWDVTGVTVMDRMFTGATLSTANYNALLVGWEAQLVQNNVTFDGGNSTYTAASAAATARAALIADHTWTITDGGAI